MLWILIAVLALVVLAAVWGISSYNGFVKQRNVIQESWRQVDVELNRRYELIPNLVETVRAFAAHERNTLEEVTRLRNQASGLAHQQAGDVPTAERAQLEGQLSGAVHNLLVSVEAYPELRSDRNFLELQRELTETEDRIAAGRRFYNANVRAYNTRVESLPSNFIANASHFEKAAYFEVTDAAVRQAPDVNFGEISYRGDQQASATGVRPAVEASDPNALPNPNASFGQAYPAQPYQQPQQYGTPQQPQPGRYQPPAQPGV